MLKQIVISIILAASIFNSSAQGLKRSQFMGSGQVFEIQMHIGCMALPGVSASCTPELTPEQIFRIYGKKVAEGTAESDMSAAEFSNEKTAVQMLGFTGNTLKTVSRWNSSPHGQDLCAYITDATVRVKKSGIREDDEGGIHYGLTLVSVTSSSGQRLTCQQNPESSTPNVGGVSASINFKSINDAIKALKKLPDYSTTSVSDFARVDVATGLAELDASTQMYLPPGSTDTLVIYTENNVGRPFLTVERFNGQRWSDVSASVLPGHAAKGGGSNYYLDTSGSIPKVRNVRTKKAWQYMNGKFAPEH